MIGRVRSWLRGSAAPDVHALQDEVERLRQQNEKLRQAMRHCIDCDYRVDVLARRAAEGEVAAGRPAEPTGDPA